MSFAEYGSSIFFMGKIKKPFDQGDGLSNNNNDKYFGCRLKMIDSCNDFRAWSPDPFENFKYFREITENGDLKSKDVPDLSGINVVVDVNTEKELELLRHELAKYKALKLTPEQKKQLKEMNFGEAFSKGDWNIGDFIMNTLEKLTNYKESILGTSPTKVKEMNDKNLQPPRPKPTARKNKKVKNIKRKLSTDISCSIPKDSTSECSSSSQIGLVEGDSDSSSGSSQDDNYNHKLNKIKNNRSFNDNNYNYKSDESETASVDSNKSYIIKSESIIISLENELKTKESELDELRSLNRDLKYSLQNRDAQIKNLKENFTKTQLNLQNIIDQRNNELDQWRQKSESSRILINQINRKLEERRQECYVLMQEINNLKQDTNLQALRTERDSFAKKLEEIGKLVKDAGNYGSGVEGMKALIRERNELIELKRHFEVHCSDQEYEIDRLNKLINHIKEDHESQRIEMSRVADELEEELRIKSDKIDYCEEQINHYKNHMMELKHELEESNQARERESISDRDLDTTLAKYLKKSSEQIDQLSTALHGAGHDVEKNKMEIDYLRQQISKSVQEKLDNEKNFSSKWEQCQQTIKTQINEIEKLRKYNCKLNKDVQHNDNLKHELNEMTSRVASMQKEHSNLTNELEHLKECLDAKNLEVVSLEEEKENLKRRIDCILRELEDKNNKISVLERTNFDIHKKLYDTEKNVKAVSDELQSIKYEDNKILQITMLQRDLEKGCKEKRKLEDAVSSLRKEYDSCCNLNKRLNDNLMNKSNQILIIKRDIKRLTSDFTDNIYSDGSIIKLPDKLHESLNILKQHIETDNSNEKGATDLNDNDYDNLKDKIDNITKTFNYSDNDQSIKSMTSENKDLAAMSADRAILQEFKQNSEAAFKLFNKNHTSCVAKKFDTRFFDNESGFISDANDSSVKSPNDNNYHPFDSIPTYLNKIKSRLPKHTDFNNDFKPDNDDHKNKHDDNRHNVLSKYHSDKSRQRNTQFMRNCCERSNKN
ncbi:putative leucine-rich repeat-containing protein DDB_G0290503 [Microplitis mediator]|uniref:putative leucine-rich repeat-containing protein DDB_G0290503 n=1 Tax=Microplitis mediator TaxID=375433 RepID=UPI0025563EBB|nr:putative leucine-rich repeat-containing protein DDB_G0290503 [Microplitis mediator]